MPTKEEIVLKETIGIFDEHELGITGLSNAMDIYAKQESIGFLIWCVENYSDPFEGFSINMFLDGHATIWDKKQRGNELTMEQLYELYLKSK